MSKVVLITGAAQGIGRGLVEQYLLRPETTVIAAVRNTTSAEAVSLQGIATAPGSKIINIHIDAKSDTDAIKAVEALQQQHALQHIDIVIANSGIFDFTAHQKVHEMRLGDLKEHIDVNAYGVIRLFQATWPLLQKAAKPIFFLNSAAAASMSGMKSFSHFPLSSYAASKALANFFILRLHEEHPNLIAFAAHPGSVGTRNRTIAAERLGVSTQGLSVEECVDGLLKLLDHATSRTTSGTFVNFDGTPIPW